MEGYEVRDLRERDRAAWAQLWAGYLDFYGARLGDAVTETTWRRLLDPDPDIGGFVAVDAMDTPSGVVHYVVHATTWDMRPIAYLQDLFVAVEHRGRGVGRALIKRVIELGRHRDWCAIHWITAADNATARTLYRRVARETDWVRYEIGLDEA